MFKNTKKYIKKIIPWMNIENKIYKLYVKANKNQIKKNYLLASFYMNKIYKKYKCHIHANAKIGYNLLLPHPIGVIIGANAIIGDNVTLYQNVTVGKRRKEENEYPIIGNNVTVYCNSVIIGNVHIGNNAIIGCNSIVLRDVKDGEVVCGIVK